MTLTSEHLRPPSSYKHYLTVLTDDRQAVQKSNKGREAIVAPETGEVDAAVLHEHGDRGEAAVGRPLQVHRRADGADEAHGVGHFGLERDGRRPRQLARELLPLPRGLRLRLRRRFGYRRDGRRIFPGARRRGLRWRRLGPACVGFLGGRGEGRGGGGGEEEEAVPEEARQVVVHGGRKPLNPSRWPAGGEARRKRKWHRVGGMGGGNTVSR
jgi:hypothetical protein